MAVRKQEETEFGVFRNDELKLERVAASAAEAVALKFDGWERVDKPAEQPAQ